MHTPFRVAVMSLLVTCQTSASLRLCGCGRGGRGGGKAGEKKGRKKGEKIWVRKKEVDWSERNRGNERMEE